MNYSKRIATITLMFIAVASISLADQWPHWRGPDYDGVSKETNWDAKALDNPVIAWKAEIGTGFSAVSIIDGRAYTIGNINKDTDVIYCFDSLTGKKQWDYQYLEPLTPKLYEGGCNATPTIHAGKVYTFSRTGKVFCLNVDTGELIWKRKLSYKKPGWGFSGSPVIVDDLVIFNAGAAGVALNKADGAVVWESEDDEAGYATPVPFERNGKKYVAMFCKSSLKIIEALTGTVEMSHKWDTKYGVNAADPIIFGDEIFITSGYGYGVALLKMTDNGLEEVWRNKNMRSQMSGPVLINGYVYGIDDNQLACVEWKTGKKMWTEKTPKKGALCAAGDKLIVLGEKGKLFIVQSSPEGYQELSSAQVLSDRCWTMPVLSNGRIYVRNAVKNKMDKLLCIDVQNENAKHLTPTGLKTDENQWPQWKGPKRDNMSTETGLARQWPAEGPAMLWFAEGLGKGYATVSIAGEKIYTTGMLEKEGYLFCFDLNGKLLWKQSYGPEWAKSFPGPRCTPTVDDGFVYVISGVGKVACFKADTGEKSWLVDPVTDLDGKSSPWGLGESPLIVDDKVIITVGGEKAMVAALDKKNGKTIWTTPGNGDKNAYCSPTSFTWGGKTIIAGMTNNYLFAVNAADGSLLWTYPIKDYVPGKVQPAQPNTPYFKEGYLFFTSGYDMGAIQLKLSDDGTEAEKVWINPALDCHHGSFAVVDGYIYSPNWQSNSKGDWMCVDWKTGKTVYEQSWENKGSLMYADGMLYCYEEGQGNLALVKADSKGFEPISSFKIEKGEKEHWAHPVICGKRLYVRHGDVLMAFDIAAG